MAQVVTTEVGLVEYSSIGRGTPVLFIHGGHGNCNETLFHKGFDLKYFKLITPSRPGYGKTPLPSFTTPKATARLLVALLDTLHIEKVIIMGISAGGLTAIELAANYPHRVSKLLLVSAVTKKWMTLKDPNYRKGRKLFSPAVEKYSWALFRFFYALLPGVMAKTMLHELSTSPQTTIAEADIKELQTMIKHQRSGHGFLADLDHDIDASSLSRIACPTLILHSHYDKTVPLAHATHAQKEIRGASLITYKNQWGHLLWLGQDSSKPILDALYFIKEGQANLR